MDGEAPSTTTYEYDQLDAKGRASVAGERDGRHRLSSLIKRTAAGALLLAMNYSVDASRMRTGVVG